MVLSHVVFVLSASVFAGASVGLSDVVNASAGVRGLRVETRELTLQAGSVVRSWNAMRKGA